MTTILILNAASSLLAAAGLTGLVLTRRRADRERAAQALVYVAERN